MLLAAGQPAEAEAAYREELKRNPDNGWSLRGLVASLDAQGRKSEAAAVEKDRARAWQHADVELLAVDLLTHSMQTIADTLRLATQGRPGPHRRGRRRPTASAVREFGERCGRARGALRGLGLSRGDRVAILAGNGHRYLETYVGAPAAGFVIVPLNTRHAAPELEYAVRDSGARVLLTDRPAGVLARLRRARRELR